MILSNFYKILFSSLLILFISLAFLSFKIAIIIFLILHIIYGILRINGFLPKQSYKGKHILITGAGSGIGKRVAILFANSGSKLSLCDINLSSVQQLEKELNAKTLIAKAIYCDVTNKEQVTIAFNQAKSNFGQIDLLINNAGIVYGKQLAETPLEKIEQTFSINLISHFYTIKEVLPEMLEKNEGHIVEIASMAGILGTAQLVDYCSTKFGVVGLYESLKCELYKLNKNIQLTCICPFFINTGMFEGATSPLGILLPILKEDYVANRIKNAIEQGEGIVFLPWICYSVLIVKALLPEMLSEKIQKLFGSTTYMNKFEGRKQK